VFRSCNNGFAFFIVRSNPWTVVGCPHFLKKNGQPIGLRISYEIGGLSKGGVCLDKCCESSLHPRSNLTSQGQHMRKSTPDVRQSRSRRQTEGLSNSHPLYLKRPVRREKKDRAIVVRDGRVCSQVNFTPRIVTAMFSYKPPKGTSVEWFLGFVDQNPRFRRACRCPSPITVREIANRWTSF